MEKILATSAIAFFLSSGLEHLNILTASSINKGPMSIVTIFVKQFNMLDTSISFDFINSCIIKAKCNLFSVIFSFYLFEEVCRHK